MDKHPICSSNRGYYFASDKEEIIQTINQLTGRIKGISNAINGLQKSIV